MEDEIEERSVDILSAVVVNEAQFASVKDDALTLPERRDWRCTFIHRRAMAEWCRALGL